MADQHLMTDDEWNELTRLARTPDARRAAARSAVDEADAIERDRVARRLAAEEERDTARLRHRLELEAREVAATRDEAARMERAAHARVEARAAALAAASARAEARVTGNAFDAARGALDEFGRTVARVFGAAREVDGGMRLGGNRAAELANRYDADTTSYGDTNQRRGAPTYTPTPGPPLLHRISGGGAWRVESPERGPINGPPYYELDVIAARPYRNAIRYRLGRGERLDRAVGEFRLPAGASFVVTDNEVAAWQSSRAPLSHAPTHADALREYRAAVTPSRPAPAVVAVQARRSIRFDDEE